MSTALGPGLSTILTHGQGTINIRAAEDETLRPVG